MMKAPTPGDPGSCRAQHEHLHTTLDPPYLGDYRAKGAHHEQRAESQRRRDRKAVDDGPRKQVGHQRNRACDHEGEEGGRPVPNGVRLFGVESIRRAQRLSRPDHQDVAGTEDRGLSRGLQRLRVCH